MSEMQKLADSVSPKLTGDVLEKVLKKKHGGPVSLKKVKVTPPNSKTGDSYLSVVTRFVVEYTARDENGADLDLSLPLIAKGLPKNMGRRKTFRSCEFFKNEVAFYEKVWPVLDAFQKSKNVKEPFANIPTYLSGCADGTNDYILMEDLSYEGFRHPNRSEGLDLDHVKLIVRLFAKFHALGLAYNEQHPEEFRRIADELSETYFSERLRPWYVDFQKVLMDVTRDAVKKELPEVYLNKLDKIFNDDFYGTICKSAAERGRLATITHGDDWVPNFLLRYDDESKKPIMVFMIDFQLTRCSSLSLDVLFFMFSCTEQEFRTQHYKEILSYYRTHFTNFLKELGSDEKLLTEEIFEEDMKKHAKFAIGMGIEAVVMALLDDDEVSDIDQVKGDVAVPLTSIWVVKPLKTQEKRRRVAGFIKDVIDYYF